MSFFELAHQALMCHDEDKKVRLTHQLFDELESQSLTFSHTKTVETITAPGRPERPELVSYQTTPKRDRSELGMIKTIHSICHIEFNAINLALDALYRFREMPPQYYKDWTKVAHEEALHFTMISNYLQELGYQYGDFEAHNGLWEMTVETDYDVLARMALVPRVLEARGLDVTPSIQTKFRNSQFPKMTEILEVIFQDEIGIHDGLEIHLEKRLPVAAGIGGGSGNAATTLRSLNQLYEGIVGEGRLRELAAQLGSDIPFFLDAGPGIATGRGEVVETVPRFSLFRNAGVLLVNPGFGVSTPWAYKNFRLNEAGATCPNTLSHFLEALRAGDWDRVPAGLFNSLEQPVFRKYLVLKLIRSELIVAGAKGALLSGSGATVFGLVQHLEEGEAIRRRFLASYGENCWSQVVPLWDEKA